MVLHVSTHFTLTLLCGVAQSVCVSSLKVFTLINRSVYVSQTVLIHRLPCVSLAVALADSCYSHFLHSVSASTSLSTRDTSLNRFLWVSRTISGSPPLSVRNRSKSSTMMPVYTVCSADEWRKGIWKVWRNMEGRR